MPSPSVDEDSSAIASTSSATSSTEVKRARRLMPSIAFARPLLERGAESVVQRFLGEVEIAKQTHERGEDAPRFGAVNLLDSRSDVLRHAIAGCLVRAEATERKRYESTASAPAS